MDAHTEMLSSTNSHSILSPSEGNGTMFLTGYNRLLANDDTMAVRDFYLLLMVYVNYFCMPVLSFVLKGIGGFGKGIVNEFRVMLSYIYTSIDFLVEGKEYILKLFSLPKEQLKFNFILRKLHKKTVLL